MVWEWRRRGMCARGPGEGTDPRLKGLWKQYPLGEPGFSGNRKVKETLTEEDLGICYCWTESERATKHMEMAVWKMDVLGVRGSLKGLK